jgi:hypothetical protein
MQEYTIGKTYQFKDDADDRWETGTLNSISTGVPLTYQSKCGNTQS